MEDAAFNNGRVSSGGSLPSHLSSLSDGNRNSTAQAMPEISKPREHEHPVVPRVMRGQARSVIKPARFRESPTAHLDPALERQPTAVIPTSALPHTKRTNSSPISPTVLNNVPKSLAPTKKSSSPSKHVANAAITNYSGVEGKIPPEQENASGAWSIVEQTQFQQGCVLHGWGNWSLIRGIVTTRNRHQIKSHAQKFARSYPHVKAELCQKHMQFLKRNMGVAKKNQVAQKKRSEMKQKSSTQSVQPDARNITQDGIAMKNNLNYTHRMKTDHISPTLISNPNETTRPFPTATATRVNAGNNEAFAKSAAMGSGPVNHQLKSVNPLGTGLEVGSGTGTWSEAEHRLFEKGCVKYGWGSWKDISQLLTTRTRLQIKSHAQKFLRIHPREKARFDREHAKFYRSKLASRAKKEPCADSMTAGDNIAPKKSARADTLQRTNKKSSEGSIAKPPLTSRRAPGWTFIEEKQFEDGCIFHGWGNWRDIAAHIFSKTMPEVFAFAQSYNRDDRESLEREHRLHYQCDDSIASNKTTVPTQIRHALLGTSGVKAKEESPAQASQNPTPKKNNFDDYGAATAILALRELGCK